jgi:selenium metabolism protein YedF
LVDNEPATLNLARMAAGLGHAFHCEAAEAGRFAVTLTAGARPAAAAAAGRLVVAIGHDLLGSGPGPDLGRNLMKAFIYSLTELDPPPEHLLFFNGGAFLTTEGSRALDDLKTLENKGVTINTCGACLNFYQLTLKIGSITDMFSIVATLAQAEKAVTL